jgi:hypothetical protein
LPQVDSQAFLASLYTSLGISAAIALAFCFLRPYNTIVYAPRLRHADEKHAPPPLGRGPFAWFKPVFSTKEMMLVEKVGMDAAIFIRFTKMCRNIFLILTVIGCAVLIPIYVTSANSPTTGISWLTKITVTFLVGRVFWALVACAWVIDVVVCGFLFWNYRAVARLRRAYFESLEYQNSLHSRTVMVSGVDAQSQRSS